MRFFDESTVEEAAFEWLEALAYQLLRGPDIETELANLQLRGSPDADEE